MAEVPSFLQEALQHLVEDDPSLLDGFSIIDSALLEGQNTRTLWMEANHRAAEEAAAAQDLDKGSSVLFAFSASGGCVSARRSEPAVFEPFLRSKLLRACSKRELAQVSCASASGRRPACFSTARASVLCFS